jgi:hypothetical protein
MSLARLDECRHMLPVQPLLSRRHEVIPSRLRDFLEFYLMLL